MRLYQSKKHPWRWIVLTHGKYEKHVFFRVGYGCRWWLWMFIPPLFFWRDNSHTKIGIGAFKHVFYIGFHK